ncbi:hypothetical protein AZA_87727 [Nitrospirillum viridazoti Y2]|nr:hypothetical protein AZA_87727 [Nitrospirillum amazonense Y2]
MRGNNRPTGQRHQNHSNIEKHMNGVREATLPKLQRSRKGRRLMREPPDHADHGQCENRDARGHMQRNRD